MLTISCSEGSAKASKPTTGEIAEGEDKEDENLEY